MIDEKFETLELETLQKNGKANFVSVPRSL
jgi:hypothetical protein